MTAVERRPEAARALPTPMAPIRWLFRSLVGRLFLLLVIFYTVPVILYWQFQQADSDKRTLLLESVREQGRLLAESLRPILDRDEPSPLLVLPEVVARLATPQTGVKVLFRPKDASGAEGFYLVAVEPVVPPADMESERARLIARGVLDNLVSTCEGEMPVALRYRRGQGEELLTSITPITTEAGCWAVVTAHSGGAFLGTSIGQPYWKTLEVRSAIFIYFVMAFLTIGLFLSVWRSLMRFRQLARDIRTGAAPHAGFEEQNRVPELATVAGEFDRMTHALQGSAASIHRAAEDNAHAFKTPIAIIRQSLEPLRRFLPEGSDRCQRALDAIEVSIDRLEQLVVSARQLDRATAELIDPPRYDVDISRLVERMIEAYGDSFSGRGARLESRLEEGVVVRAGEELLETVIENVIDNALGVSPADSTVRVELKTADGRAELAILDEGPGVASVHLEHIFERYVSLLPEGGAAARSADRSGPHLGIGLWIVRRNLEAVGGEVLAENRPGGGLAVIIRLPLAG